MQIYRSLDEVKEAGAIAPDSIVNADCLEAMKLIEDKSVDAIICDLPYGLTSCTWDSAIPFDLLWEQYKRIIKPNGAIVLFGSQPFTSALVMSNPKWFKYEWIWGKRKGGNIMHLKEQPYRVHENVLVFSQYIHNYHPIMTPQKERVSRVYSDGKANGINGYRDARIYNEKNPKTILDISNASQKDRSHPTQKPVPLIEYLLKTYSLEGELILDNTSGSGTLAIAAINTNRRYILIEKDPEYFQISCDRVSNHDPNALAMPKKAKKPRAITESQLALFG